MSSEKLRGHLAMALFAMLIALSFSLGHRAAQHIESGALNSVRFLLGALLMGVIAYARAPRGAKGALFRPQKIWRFVVLGVLMGAYFVTMFIALEITSPISTGAVFTLMPLLTAAFALLILHQAVGPVYLVSLMIAAAGAVWVIFRGELAALMAFDIGRGEIFYFVGVACHALYAPLVKKLNRGEAVSAFTFWTLVGSWAAITIYAAPELVATNWAALPRLVWLTIAYLAVFTTAGTFFLLQYAAMRIPAGKALAYGYLTPVYIIVLEGIAGAGWVSPAVMVGALVIVLGLAVLILSPDE